MKAVVAVAIVVAGCSSMSSTTSDASDGYDVDSALSASDVTTPKPVAITVTPRSSLVVVDLMKPAPTLRFTTSLGFDDSTARDVTTAATYALDDPSIGSFTGASLTFALASPEAGASREATATARMAVFEATSSITALYLREGDVGFATGACPDAKPIASTDSVIFESHGRPHTARVLPDESAAFVTRLEAIHRTGCSSSSLSDADGDGIADTFDAPLVGERLCYRVVPAAAKLYAIRKEVVTYVVATIVGEDGGAEPSQRFVILIVAPKVGVPC